MNKIYLFCALFFLTFTPFTQAQNLLQSELDEPGVQELVEGIDTWRMSQKKDWKDAFQSLPETYKDSIVKVGEKALKQDWSQLLASGYLEYKHNGNRSRYQAKMNQRRNKLSRLVLAEMVEQKGKFIPQIADGLWLILEESTWVLPAHIEAQKEGVGLPDPTDSYIDLGAGSTATEMALAYFLLKDSLDSYDNQISKKIYTELEKRIFTPYLQHDDFWWMALKNPGTINNWNIWVNTNVLKTALLVDEDTERLEDLLQKIAKSADQFLNSYPEDGAADEGPTYWQHAGGELIQMLDWLKRISREQIYFNKNEKIHHMGRYVMETHIAGDKFLNYADAHTKQIPFPPKLWSYGTYFQDEEMKSFAQYMQYLRGRYLPLQSVDDFISYLEVYPDLFKVKTDFEHTIASFYYPSVQLAIARSQNPKGNLVFSAIGGNNGVSHNHNDVGSFMLYEDTHPILIDAGVGTYTKKTFSADRYTLWNMQSQWHSVPIINGVQQKFGSSYRAEKAKFTSHKKKKYLELAIQNAYPKDAQVKEWTRSFDFMPQENLLQIKEDYKLKKHLENSRLVLLTAEKPELEKGKIKLTLDSGKNVLIQFNPNQLEASFDKKVLEDNQFIKVWGKEIYRIILEIKNQDLEGAIEYTVQLL